jgi:hypothetical protein
MKRALRSALILAVSCGGTRDAVMSPPRVEPTATPVVSSAAPDAATAPKVDMRPLVATKMSTELEALGLDPSRLPQLAKLEPKVLRKLMPLFSRSLGVKCAGCHAEDMAAPTPHKKVAEKMWNELVVKLKTPDGGAIFCDSCHQGRIEQLDRSDHEALARWMDTTFTKGLVRRDGKENTCATCHGEPRDDHFLERWER